MRRRSLESVDEASSARGAYSARRIAPLAAWSWPPRALWRPYGRWSDSVCVYAVVRTFWKSRLVSGGSYFGSAVVTRDVEVVPHALKKSARSARKKREK